MCFVAYCKSKIYNMKVFTNDCAIASELDSNFLLVQKLSTFERAINL